MVYAVSNFSSLKFLFSSICIDLIDVIIESNTVIIVLLLRWCRDKRKVLVMIYSLLMNPVLNMCDHIKTNLKEK